MESAPLDPKGHSFVFRSRPRTLPKWRVTTPRKSDRVRSNESSETVNWAPDVPKHMLFSHRAQPEDANKLLAGDDWNISTGPLEMHEHIFQSQGENVENTSTRAAELSQSHLGDASSVVKTTMNLMHSSQTAAGPSSEVQLVSLASPHHPINGALLLPSYQGSFPVPMPLLPYVKNSPAGFFDHSVSSVYPASNSVECPSPMEPSSSQGNQCISSLRASNEVSPYPAAHTQPSSLGLHSLDQHESERLLHGTSIYPPLHYSASEPSQSSPGTPQTHAARTSSHSRQDSAHIATSSSGSIGPPHPMLPQGAPYLADPRPSYAGPPDGRRLSLPAITSLPLHSALPASQSTYRPHHSFVGPNPNQTSYFAPLLVPRVYPRLPDPTPEYSTKRLPPPQPPLPHPSLAQFSGPRSFSHPEISLYPLNPSILPPMAQFSYVPHPTVIPSVAGSVPSSCAASPLPSPALSTSSSTFVFPHLPEARPEIKRAASWTEHFESLPVPKTKIRPRRSRARKAIETQADAVKKEQEFLSRMPSPALLHQCPMCDRAFQRRNGLAIHLKWHYKPEEPPKDSEGMGFITVNFNANDTVRPQDLMINSGEQIAVSSSNNAREECPDRGAETSSSKLHIPPQQRTGALSINKLVASGHQPITPLATPPPSPESSQDTKSCEENASKSGSRQYPHGNVIWPDLFGSDD